MAATKKDTAGVSTTVTTRRPALGELVNRTHKTNQNNIVIDAKKTTTTTTHQSSTENENLSSVIVDLKKVKPRVDTHWSKATQPTRKIVTRSSSLRSNSGTSVTQPTANPPLVATAAVNAISGPKLLRAKSSTTATLREVKYVTSNRTSTRTEKSKSPERNAKSRTGSVSSVSIRSETITSNKISIGNASKNVRKGSFETKSIKQEAVVTTTTTTTTTATNTTDDDKISLQDVKVLPQIQAHSTNMLCEVSTID